MATLFIGGLSLHFQYPLTPDARSMLVATLSIPAAEDGQNFLFNAVAITKRKIYDIHRLAGAGNMRFRGELPDSHPDHETQHRTMNDGRSFRLISGRWVKL